MRIPIFPGCCGATIMYDLSGENLRAGLRFAKFPYDEKEWSVKAKDGTTIQTSEIRGEMAVFATTVEQQKDANKQLRELGFVPIFQWMNGLTHEPGKDGNWITLWGLAPAQGGGLCQE